MIWKEKYCIGVELIDKQHKELFERLNSFLKIVRNDQPVEDKIEEIEKTFNFMGEYVVTHFNAEEAVQRRHGYPEYEKHHRIHEKFKEEVAEFKNNYDQDKHNEELVMEFSGRLLTWLINHVTYEDQKISDYVNKGGQN